MLCKSQCMYEWMDGWVNLDMRSVFTDNSVKILVFGLFFQPLVSTKNSPFFLWLLSSRIPQIIDEYNSNK